MKKTNKVLLGALAVLLLLGSIEIAFAWGAEGTLLHQGWKAAYHKMGKAASPHSGAVDLNLSREQIKKMQNLKLRFQKEVLKLKNTLQVKQLELRTLWLSEEPNQVNLDSKVEEIGKLRIEIQKKVFVYLIQAKKVLTPEQWDKLCSYRYLNGRKWGDSRRLLP